MTARVLHFVELSDCERQEAARLGKLAQGILGVSRPLVAHPMDVGDLRFSLRRSGSSRELKGRARLLG